ncbi:MAG: SprB repeat-containing protein [Saprospiraceae bacterium]
MSAGTYCVTVTDANNCTETTCVTVNAIGGPVVTTTVTDILCHGEMNGSIDLSVSGGTGPYIYNWSNGESSQDLTNLSSPGTYTVTVTDATGCSVTTSGVVNEPSALNLSLTATDASCGQNNGSINLTVKWRNSWVYVFMVKWLCRRRS